MSADPEELREWLEELDHQNTDEAICPHCGAVQRDAWECFASDSSECVETECGSCEQPITVTQNVSVTYSTKKGHA